MTGTTLVFDIETVPDVALGRRVHGLGGLPDAEVAKAMFTLRRQRTGEEFLPLGFHRIVAISCVLRSREGLKLWSLGEAASGEAELIERFFDGIERFSPVLVSWNGCGFDLPVLHYRALIHGIAAPRYWDTGQLERDAKWDNYLGRYQFRHTDVMDVLALYNARAFAPLHEIAVLLDLPGKLGMDGSKVAEAFGEGRIGDIRAYCETDVLNTYLVWLRFQRIRGLLGASAYAQELEKVRTWLDASGAPHWIEFRDAWREVQAPVVATSSTTDAQ